MQGRILVKEIHPQDKTTGGLILPESATKKALVKAEVIRVGLPIQEYDCSEIKEGAIVLFVEYAGAEVEEEGEKCLLVRYEDIIGVIEE